jgi:hypothetical protein
LLVYGLKSGAVGRLDISRYIYVVILTMGPKISFPSLIQRRDHLSVRIKRQVAFLARVYASNYTQYV